MDWISELPDALLLQILSFVPTKDLVSTSVLSKRWETLWMLVPNLKYDVEYGSDSRLVSRFLLLHKAPVLESLCLKIKKFHYSHLDIGIWVRTAVDRRVRTLEIELYPSGEDPIRLSWLFCLTGDMPELVEADLDIVYDKLDKLLGSLTFVKRLSVCSTYSSPPIGTTFLKLVYLELCTCEPEWQNLLVCLLKVTPKLRVLKLKRTHNDCNKDGCWNQPDSVPDCLLTSLEIFEWRKYKGTKDQRYVATYILRNSCYLKMAKIRTKSDDNGKQLEMLKKLSFTPRASATCEVDFE
ncbi:F-box/FBD/LRR-repeat protein [Raphanus sativus]|nr:F-box/FBD/LRR-repeat protein [Raphanus sativus]